MLNQRNENVLLIFIKNPKKGRVKTRLAEDIGSSKALDVYQQLLKITKSITDQLKVDRQVWYSDFIDNNDIWSDGGYAKRLQSGDDLGERMKEAFRQAFASEYEKVVIIGSDCAEMTPQILEQSFQALDDADIVIGPSKDGGYYLLGMSFFYPDLFADIKWSTPTVYDRTISKITTMNLPMHTLPVLNDIDNEEDLLQSEVSKGKL